MRHKRTSDYRSYILVSKLSEDATSRYQTASPPTTTSNQKKHQMQFNKHPQHPNDEMGEPPFFDVCFS